MWDATAQFVGKLPPGFRLTEDEDHAYLFYGDIGIANFSHGADPKEIEKAAEEYLQSVSKS